MRKKALLVGAVGPFSGPWVNLEEGEWAIVGPTPDFVGIQMDGSVNTIPLDYAIIGPNRVRALVGEECKTPVFLQICMVRR